MCRICEAMPLNQKYVSPYAKSEDIYASMSMSDIKALTKRLIDGIIQKSRESDEQARLARTGQTRLF